MFAEAGGSEARREHAGLEGTQAVETTTHVEETEDEVIMEDLEGVYTYKPLNSISGRHVRLIELLPGDDDEPIESRLHHVNLDDNPVYEAISYTWADEYEDSSLARTILCSRPALRITASCEMALRRVRLLDTIRIVWVDSICIDQSNLEERGHQFSIMRDIYTEASGVLIYAGEASGNDRILRILAGHAQRPFHRMSPIHAKLTSEAVDELFLRPWFHRIWVLQEVVLATQATFITGKTAVDWSFFSVKRIAELNLQFFIKDGALPYIPKWMARDPSRINLLSALVITRNCLATDPRDKVFALSGLLTDPLDRPLVPNYELPPRGVFIRTTTFLITGRNSLAVLSEVEDRPLDGFAPRPDPLGHQYSAATNSYLPSWVPIWAYKKQSRPLEPQFRDPGLWDSDNAWCYTNDDARRLQLGPMSGGSTGPDFLAAHDAIQMSILIGIPAILVAQAVQLDLVHRFGFEVHIRENIGWTQRTLIPGRNLWLHDPKMEQIFEYHTRSKGAGRRVFEPQKSIAIGPVSTQSDDTIWRLFGASVPFVPRGIHDEYIIIGECYLHGAERIGCQLQERAGGACYAHHIQSSHSCGIKRLIQLR
jgi:hypothetical protein